MTLKSNVKTTRFQSHSYAYIAPLHNTKLNTPKHTLLPTKTQCRKDNIMQLQRAQQTLITAEKCAPLIAKHLLNSLLRTTTQTSKPVAI